MNFMPTATGRETTGADAHVDEGALAEFDQHIAVALEYEKHLARKQYRVRQFILNLKAKRDHLRDLGEAIWRGA